MKHTDGGRGPRGSENPGASIPISNRHELNRRGTEFALPLAVDRSASNLPSVLPKSGAGLCFIIAPLSPEISGEKPLPKQAGVRALPNAGESP